MIGLILLHGGNRGGIPIAIGLGRQVVLADEGLLNLRYAVGIDGLLAASAARFMPTVRELMGRAGVAGGDSVRVRGERGRRKESRGDQKRQSCAR